MNKAILFGLMAVVALFVAGCVTQDGQATATPQASVAPIASVAPAVTDAQVNEMSAQVDNALSELDTVTDELTDINSQDMNSSIIDATG